MAFFWLTTQLGLTSRGIDWSFELDPADSNVGRIRFLSIGTGKRREAIVTPWRRPTTEDAPLKLQFVCGEVRLWEGNDLPALRVALSMDTISIGSIWDGFEIGKERATRLALLRFLSTDVRRPWNIGFDTHFGVCIMEGSYHCDRGCSFSLPTCFPRANEIFHPPAVDETPCVVVPAAGGFDIYVHHSGTGWLRHGAEKMDPELRETTELFLPFLAVHAI